MNGRGTGQGAAWTRRNFLAAAAATGLGMAVSSRSAGAADAVGKPALLGGKPVRKKPFPEWPISDAREERALIKTLKSGQWYRGGAKNVDQFEEAYAQLMGSKYCIATANGTSALVASLGALEIGPGDEVIVTPYTFIASINAILMHFALPVFVDVDPATFQIDPNKIEAAITERTAAIMPVHIGGNVSNMDLILEVARKHKLPVIEDACQAHLAEWRGKKAGSLGTTGCFSFQVSKNLCSGEGGAILTNDKDLSEKIYAFHCNGRPRTLDSYQFKYLGLRATNFRLTEFQGALLLAQMTRLKEQTETRTKNANYLTSMLSEIPGIQPAKMYEGCTRNAYHLYMFRYKAGEFAGLPKGKFMDALQAEGVPCSGGYTPIDWSKSVQESLTLRGYQRVFSEEVIDQYGKRCQIPENDKLCDEAVWLFQSMLLGPRSDMDEIAEAIRKIKAYAAELAKA